MSSSESKSVAFVIDPIEHIKAYKDSTVAMMRAAMRAGADIYYMTAGDIFIDGDMAKASAHPLRLLEDEVVWYGKGEAAITPLKDFKQIWMRKDPPVDKRFIHTCYMLEHAVRNGATVLNNPTALIALNEKLFAAHFPSLCPATLVSSNLDSLREFLSRHRKIIVKPLDAMGGAGVFMVEARDVNLEVIWEVQTQNGAYPVIAQEFLPGISEGDKRVIMINGKPFSHALVRSPKDGSIRGNIAAGGTTTVRPITDREKEICEEVGPELVRRGIVFAGLDIIGDKLIEINITSPTGLREISKACGIDVAEILMAEALG